MRADATITANQLAGSKQNIPVSLARLATLTRDGGGLFWITVRGDQVVRIGERWLKGQALSHHLILIRQTPRPWVPM